MRRTRTAPRERMEDETLIRLIEQQQMYMDLAEATGEAIILYLENKQSRERDQRTGERFLNKKDIAAITVLGEVAASKIIQTINHIIKETKGSHATHKGRILESNFYAYYNAEAEIMDNLKTIKT